MGCNSSKNDTTAISAPIPAPATETKAISNEVHTNEQTPIKVENIILEPSDISGVEKSEDKIGKFSSLQMLLYIHKILQTFICRE